MPSSLLPSLSVAKTLPRTTEVLVIGMTDSGLRGLPASEAAAFSKRFGTSVEEMARSVGARATAGACRTLPAAASARILVVGLGTGVLGAEDLRRGAAVGVRHAGGLAPDHGSVSVAVAFDAANDVEAQAIAEGALLGSYRYAPVSGTAADPDKVGSVTVLYATRGTALADAARTVAEAVVAAREWINIPANLLYPGTFADQVTESVKDVKVSVEVLDETALARDGYGGLMSVGGGSDRPPRLVRLSYRPRGAKFHLALIGKGITFDTGGLNLKPGDSMYTMKCDMSGAAAVFAATKAIAQLGLKIQVTTYGALAENMPSGSAYRPSDVLTIYGGTTVENGNSDAEGRIVMADALARAAEDKPDLVIDVATLTGACVVALGERVAGVMTNDQATADRILAAAEAAGEDFWQLPIPKETRGKLDSKVADLKSTGTDRWGGAMVAAAFLREFVTEGTPWAHLDIAGPAFHESKPYGYVSPGGTGFSVRTLITLAKALAG